MKTINQNNFVETAEQAIISLRSGGNDRNRKSSGKNLTTSQIRNLLSMTADIYNKAVECREDALPEDICAKIQYLKIRMVYEVGRDKAVEKFVETAKLLEIIDEIEGSRKNYLLFAKYMEALVAYHRFYGGRD